MLEFRDDRCTQSAAAVSYYTLFAVFPTAILLVVAFGIVVSDAGARDRVVQVILDAVPLSEGQGRLDIEQALRDATRNPGALGVLGLAGLAFSATGVMGAIRNALNTAIEAEQQARPFVRGKLLDILLVLTVGVVVIGSLALTLLTRLVRTLGDTVRDAVGGTLGEILALPASAGQLVPVLVSLAIFAAVFRFVPARPLRLRDSWPGVVVAAIGYELAKTGFSIYVENFKDYTAVYGSLGAAAAFLFFVFVAANVVLLGAEVASEWPGVRDGEAGRGSEEGGR